MTLAEESAGADTSPSQRVPDRLRPARRRQGWRWQRKLATSALATLLVGLMQWPGAAQSVTTSTTTSSPPTTAATTSSTAAPTTAAPTTAAPTTAAPTTAAPTTSGNTATTAGVTTSQLETTAATGTATTVNAADKAKIDAAAATKARQVDAANAKLEDLSTALKTLNKQVSSQTARVDYANQQLGLAEEKVKASNQAVTDAESGLSDLELKMQGQAIRNFMGGDGGQAAVLVTGDPNQSIRMQTMLAEVTKSDIDLSATLQSAKEDLEVQRAEAMNAQEEAEALRGDAADQLDILQGDRLAQTQLTSSAEARLGHLLSERQALGALGDTVEAGGTVELDLVNSILSASGNAPAPSQDIAVPATVSASEIALAGNGIRVHVSIVDNVKRLLAAASAAGLDLGGGGYRDPASQIAIRKSNCGTSNYAIYQMPASRCHPPTAIPGDSMHEKGLAIDFTNNGDLIKSHSNAAYVWLNSHAATYGFYNLPSESWHWSTNGK